MARLARGEYLDPLTVQVVHTIQRCVRRALLCGLDPLSGADYEHRRSWIRQRLEFLASVFGIDCLTFSIMHNHMHLVLRSRPDIVRGWSDQQVARRWLKLFPKRRGPQGEPLPPTVSELNMIVHDPQRLAQLRMRLSDISWWMKCLAEYIARRANREDQCTGHFWEGRYKAQVLLDESAVLACVMYVDLNPVRAALAPTPETSQYTGARERIEDLRQPGADSLPTSPRSPTKSRRSRRPPPVRRQRSKATHRWERSRRRRHSGWLSPLEINERLDRPGPAPSSCGRRASLKGFLSLSLCRYLELLDWTGRQLTSGSRNALSPGLEPILVRLGIDSAGWTDLVARYGQLFFRAAGRYESLPPEAARRDRLWLQAPGRHQLSAPAG